MKIDGFEPDSDADEPVLFPDLQIVDAHHHLWPSGARIAYDAKAFCEDMGSGHNIVATVFVECMAAYRKNVDVAFSPIGETEFVASLAPTGDRDQSVSIGAAIVGWADLANPWIAKQTLAAHVEAGGGRLKGVRHNVVWHERPELVGGRRFPRHLLMEPPFRESLAEVARLGLVYDVWAFHGQLAEVAALADALPTLQIVLDHIGGPVTHDASPRGRDAIFSDWRTAIEDLAQRPNIKIKFGGLGMSPYGFGFDHRSSRPSSAELASVWAPYFDVVFGAFGADRSMFESNFPVDKQSFSYRAVWNAFKRLTVGLSDDERDFLFGGTARATYKIDGQQ